MTKNLSTKNSLRRSTRITKTLADSARPGPTNSSANDNLPPPNKKLKKEESKIETLPISIGEILNSSLNFNLKDHSDESIDHFDLFKDSKNGIVIFIYPKANTPGCTQQACGYKDLHQEIANAGFEVFGLSMDSPKSLLNWKSKQNLPYTLLSDPKQQLIKLLGASKSSSSIQRSHFIFDKNRKLLHVTSHASPKSSAKDALDFIKSL
ncbi:hypothetical protein O181_065119 [Austropuccinia psidii MF-1]|uniref:thioredoxin-dependent peroxiredoxin n=1 Tax=Austropuccinia psidii MF-1 TaxID=1389203 RepID=A0A9Q3EQG3_9BASI|nr:hypothetical protein [Austropuccinia psidii MF-1]